jgi:hypothetical protein
MGKMFKDNVRGVLVGVCCAAVMMCGGVSGMDEYAVEIMTDGVPSDSRLSAIGKKERLEMQHRLFYCFSDATRILSDENLEDDAIEKALDYLAYYEREVLSKGINHEISGKAYINSLFLLFSRHWERVAAKVAMNQINGRDLTIVISLVPEVLEYSASMLSYHPNPASYNKLPIIAKKLSSDTKLDIKNILKIENRTAINLIGSYWQEVFDLLKQERLESRLDG